MIKIHLLVVTLFFISFQVQANSEKGSKTVVGFSPIKSEKYDQWDEKNSAIYDAKKTLTFDLAKRYLTPESIEENEKLIEKSVLPFSNLYILNTDIIKHGPERDGEYESYQARVNFEYSLENFKKLLKSKGVLFQDLAKPKVMAFIEVVDESRLKVYNWWQEDNPKLHPVLNPIQDRLKFALEEKGYELLGPKRFSSKMGAKEMAKASGAHYYISGDVKVKYSSKGVMTLSEGEFYFYETMSQKLVSKLDIMDFKKVYEKNMMAQEKKNARKMSRGLASYNQSDNNTAQTEKTNADQQTTAAAEQPKDVLTESFRKAVDTMSVVGDTESLTQGMTVIKVQGVRSPRQLQELKSIFESLNESGLDSFVERSLTSGEAVFLARSKFNPTVLKNIIERKTPLKNGLYDESVNGLSFVFTKYN